MSNSFKTTPISEEKKRFLCIDIFRGIAIVVMIFVNTVIKFDKTPFWSKHVTDFGLTYVDLGGPIFMFAIALTYKMSYNRSMQRDGLMKTYVKFIRRYAAFLGFGMLGSKYLVTENGIKFSWGVLQAIGLAGIFTVFFIHMPRVIRFMISLGILGIYQNVSAYSIKIGGTILTISDLIYNDNHGGLVGGIIWGALMLLCTAMIDEFNEKRMTELLLTGILFIAISTTFHVIWWKIGTPQYIGISKERITPAFVLLSVGLSAVIFWLIWLLFDKYHLTRDKSWVLQPFGKNPILLYMIHPLFGFLATLYLKSDAHIALVLLSALLNLVVLWALSYWLEKKKVSIVI